MNLHDVAQVFATEDDAHEALIKTRWPKGVRCVACNSDRISRVRSLGKTGKVRRILECLECGFQFTATSGTLFHDSHLPLRKWFMAMALMCEAKKGISALQLSRHLGVQHKTAWYLCHRIRKAMEELNAPPLGGQGKVVEIDETFVGGKKRRMGLKAARDTKISVLGIAERSGRVHLQRIDNARAATLRPLLEARVSSETDKIVTDAACVYNALIPAEKHEEGVHKNELQEQGYISSTACVESAFSLFKRGVVGSFHRLSKDHLDGYLQEFCWRFNRRHMQPHLFDLLLREVATRQPLTYKSLTQEVF
jgi:transposase-like protein